jgi:hypothetical protein
MSDHFYFGRGFFTAGCRSSGIRKRFFSHSDDFFPFEFRGFIAAFRSRAISGALNQFRFGFLGNLSISRHFFS